MARRGAVAVVGSGVVGASAALALAEAGFTVTLFEAGAVGEGSSARAAGVLSEVTWDAQDREWVAESRLLYTRPPAGGPSLFRKTGSWTCAPKETALWGSLRLLAAAGTAHAVMPAIALEAQFPALRLETGVALWVPDDGVVSGGDYAREAAQALRNKGGTVVTETAVALQSQRQTGEGGATVLLPDGSRGHFDRVLVAAGAHTARVLAGLGVHAPLRPYRTQLTTVRHPAWERLPRAVVHDLALGWYWVPEGEHDYLMGDGTEHSESDPDAFRREADTAFLASVAERLAQRTWGAEGARLGRGWAGLCTATPDRRPVLGPVPGHPAVWTAAGMNGFGVMRGPAVGRAVAQALAADDPTQLPPGTRSDRAGLDWTRRADFAIREGYTLEAEAMNS